MQQVSDGIAFGPVGLSASWVKVVVTKNIFFFKWLPLNNLTSDEGIVLMLVGTLDAYLVHKLD